MQRMTEASQHFGMPWNSVKRNLPKFSINLSVMPIHLSGETWERGGSGRGPTISRTEFFLHQHATEVCVNGAICDIPFRVFFCL